ncbi:MAG TPA: hypothetical protein VIK11_01180 [Tepidiformaceae bacterium]
MGSIGAGREAIHVIANTTARLARAFGVAPADPVVGGYEPDG